MSKPPKAAKKAKPGESAVNAAEGKGKAEEELKQVTLYTDGGCSNNPGPGGYGVVLIYQKKRKELSAGYRKTTNNRMELMACIMGLKALKYPCSVKLYSDSQYVVNGIQKGWARRWKARGWMRTPEEPAENADLWSQLLELCEKHRVELVWVRGHAGNRGNERCDELAKQAAGKLKGQLIDTAYENNQTRVQTKGARRDLF